MGAVGCGMQFRVGACEKKAPALCSLVPVQYRSTFMRGLQENE